MERIPAVRVASTLLALGIWANSAAAQVQVQDEETTDTSSAAEPSWESDGGGSVDDAAASSASSAYGFGAPAEGVIRFAPRWDTFIFTQGQSSGAGSSTLTSWANLFSLEVDLGFLVLRGIVPLGFIHSSSTTAGISTSDDQAELGNLTFEGYANVALGPEHRLLLGGGIALPTATDPRCSGSFSCIRGPIVRAISWISSFRGAPLWAEQSFSIVPTAEYRLAVPWVLFSAIGSIPIFIPTDSNTGGPLGRGNVELMLALDVSGAVRIVNIVDAGISFLGWAMPSGAGLMGNPDLGQTALTFFVRTDPELDSPVNGGVEFIVNLDNGWGPTGETNRYWGLHLWVGARFDV